MSDGSFSSAHTVPLPIDPPHGTARARWRTTWQIFIALLMMSLGSSCRDTSNVPLIVVRRFVDERYPSPEGSPRAHVPTAEIAGERRPVLASLPTVQLTRDRLPMDHGRRLMIKVPIPEGLRGMPVRLNASLESSSGSIIGLRPRFIRSLPSETTLEVRLSEESMGTPGTVVIGGRTGMVESRYETEPFEVPTGARLRFAIGAEDDDWFSATPSTAFAVTVLSDGDENVLWRRTIAPGRNPDDRAWSDHEIDLGRYARRTIRLRFDDAETLSGSRPAALGVWGDPVIVAPERGIAPHRNLIIVSIDTLRADHLGCYGHGRPTSPTIDARIAAAGTLFEHAFAPGPWTFPSTTAMLTGVYPCTSRLFPAQREEPLGRIPPDVRTIAEVLRARGYATAAFTEDGWVSATTGFQRGFGTFVEKKNYPRPREPAGLAESTFNGALRWIRGHRGEPWFVFAHTYQVHHPYTPPIGYLEAVAPKHGEDRASADAAAYDAEIRYTDDVLDVFLAALDADGNGDAVLVLTSDHGEHFGEHGLWMHGNSLYDELLHVPLLLRAPGAVPAGKRVTAPVGLIDLVPTVLDVLGVTVPAGIDGRSLVPLLAGGTLPPVALYADLTGDVVAREANLKWLINERTKEAKLFDLTADPGETTGVDVTGDLVDRAREILANFSRRCGDDQAPPSPHQDQVPPAVRDKLKALGYVE